MYIELKADGVRGSGRIGWVRRSKTGKTLSYDGRTLAPLKGHALKANYFDTETLEEFWISGPRKDGRDSLYPSTITVDEDALETYWRKVRDSPEPMKPTYKSPGRSKRERTASEKAVRRRRMDRRRPPARGA